MKTIVITGASSGLGQEVAKQIAALLNLEKNCVVSQITIERFTI